MVSKQNNRYQHYSEPQPERGPGKEVEKARIWSSGWSVWVPRRSAYGRVPFVYDGRWVGAGAIWYPPFEQLRSCSIDEGIDIVLACRGGHVEAHCCKPQIHAKLRSFTANFIFRNFHSQIREKSDLCVCFFFNNNLESFTIYGHVLIFCAISVTFFGHCRAGQTAQTSSSDFGHFDGTNTKRKEIHMVFNCHRFSFRQ
jgi:hypothetical protein